MNPADLPPQLHLDGALRGDALLAAVRQIAQGPLAAQVEAPVLYASTALACLVLTYVFLRRVLWSPFGRALAGIRVNEHRMRAVGFGSFGYKLTAFTLAGALAAKKTLPPSLGSMPTHGGLFIGLLIGSVLLVGALTYLPALALGPVVEHLTLWQTH